MKKKGWKKAALFWAASLLCLVLAGCGVQGEENGGTGNTGIGTETEGKKPALPDKLKTGDGKAPALRVYQTDEEQTKEMDIEQYLQGVVAGEMKNDWPLEALKAQAILARTFVLKFCTEKESKYQGADISTDVEEAQAYDATGINDRVERAVEETRGQVLSFHGELPYAWFHAHSGGMTDRAVPGLHYEEAEPGYTKATQGRESEKAPERAKRWTAEFTDQEILKAAKTAGAGDMKTLDTIAVGEKSESGRAVTLVVNGQSVSAPEMRLALEPSKMRSTLIDSIALRDGKVTMSGKGYGHGVGMPQWGAYGMAEEGKTAEEIVTYYFQDVTVETLW